MWCYRGPPVKIGIYQGNPNRVVPHSTTGRADYFGQIVNRAARYCHGAAQGGQVLCNYNDFKEVMTEWFGGIPNEIKRDSNDQIIAPKVLIVGLFFCFEWSTLIGVCIQIVWVSAIGQVCRNDFHYFVGVFSIYLCLLSTLIVCNLSILVC